MVKRSVYEVLEVLRRGKWLILAVFLLVMIGVAVYTFTVPPKYQAYALLLIDTPGGTGGHDALSFGFIDNAGLDVRNSATQTLILQQSLTIAQRTEKRLRAMYQAGEPLTIFDVEEEMPSAEDWAVHLQKEYVSIMPLGDVRRGAIQIQATSTVPSESALIANLYAEEYVKLSQEASRQRVTASRLFLEEQVAKHRTDLLALEEQIKQYTSRDGTLALEGETQATLAQVAQIKVDLDAARIEKSVREVSLRSLTEERQELYPRLTKHVASGVEKEIEETQTGIAKLELIVAQIHARNPRLRDGSESTPELDNLLAQIEQLRGRVRQLSEQYVGEMAELSSEAYLAELNQNIIEDRIAIGAAQAKEEILEQRLREYQQRLTSIPEESIRLSQLERARQSTEQLYLSVVEMLQKTRFEEESEVGFVRMIRPALVPDKPVRPKKARNFILGAMLGLMLGIVAAIVRHGLDTRIYSPSDLRDLGLLSVLGVIPDMASTIEKRLRKASKVTVDGREVSPTLASLLNPFSLTAQACRHLYLSLQFSRPDEVVQTVLITSPEAEVGKSTTVLNLAIAAARTERRTLMVEADLRRPTLRAHLGSPAGPDLQALLSEQEAGGDVDIERLATGIENLYAITTLEPVADPAQLLESREMHGLMEQLRHAFDLILFDSPPVLLVTDALLLATQCDATVVVVAAGSTDAAALEQAVEELRRVGATIIGAVLNRFNPLRMYGLKHTYAYRYKHYNKYYQHQPVEGKSKRKKRARKMLT